LAEIIPTDGKSITSEQDLLLPLDSDESGDIGKEKSFDLEKDAEGDISGLQLNTSKATRIILSRCYKKQWM